MGGQETQAASECQEPDVRRLTSGAGPRLCDALNQPEILMPKFQIALIATFTLALAACSSAPSETDMRQALDEQYKALAMLSDGKSPIEELERIGCEKSGDAYLCDVRMTLKLPMVGKQTTTSRVRFIKTSKGWAATA